MSLLKKLRNKKLQKAVLTSIFGLSLGFLVNDIAYARTNIGDGSSATGSYAVAVGDEAKAEGNGTVVVGSDSTASGYRATSVGYNIIGVGNYSTVVGVQSTARGTDSVAIGSGSHADTDSSVAIGNVSYTSGDYAIAIGDYARAENSYVTVIGHDAEASGKYSVVLGEGAGAEGEASIAIGHNSYATNADAVAMGTSAGATGLCATAIGNNAEADGDGSTAIGLSAIADGSYSTAIGNAAYALADSSIAIGYNSVANEEYIVSFGSDDPDNGFTRRLVNVSAGVNDTDAANVSQLISSGNYDNNTKKLTLSSNSGSSVVVDLSALPSGGATYTAGQSIIIDSDVISVKKDGAVADGNTDLVTGDTVYDAVKNKADITYIDTELEGKANADASNVADHTAEWGAAIGTGVVEEGNGELVTGGTVYNVVKDKADITYVDTQLGTKADIDLGNITVDGQNVIKNIAKDSVKLENGLNTTVSSTENDDGSLTYKVNVEGTGVAEEGNTGLVSGDTLYNTVNNITNNFNTELEGKANADASNVADHTAEWGAAIGTGVVEEGNSELVTGGTVYNVVKDKADITYVDTQLGTKADIDLGNITVDGQNVIKNIAKDSVKLEDGLNTTVSSTEHEDGSVIYKVNTEGTGVAEEGNTGLVNGDTLYNTVNEINESITEITDDVNIELGNKANADASNVADHTAEWGAAIGTGVVEEGNSELVTGGTVYNVVKDKADITYVDTQLGTKADIDLGNITVDGQNVIKNIAKDSVKLENGLNTTVSSTENDDGSLTYKVNVEGTGVAEEGNTGLVSGDTLYNTVNNITNNFNTELEGKANADASNVADHTAEWGAAIGTGVVEEGNSELVTGGTVYDAVKDKADKNYVDEQLNGKADADLGNLTDEGKDVIKDIAKDTVKVEDGLNTTVTTTENNDGSLSYQVNAEGNGKAEAGNTGLINGDTLYNTVNNITNNFDTKLEGKANADASNVADHTAEWGAAIGTGVVEEGNGELVTGGTVYDAVKDKVDSDLGNLTDDGKNVIGDIAKDALQDDLDGKANIDASNIETDKWADKLGTGTISAGDNNLVTGNTVYDAIKDLGSNSLVTSDGNTISVGKNDSATVIDVSKHNSDGSTENRVITGIETDASDMSSAANVGYVNNSVSQMANEFNRGLSDLDNRMRKGVAGAAALAALNPLDYDPENKLNFAAGVGSYKGESATALGMFYRPNENIMFSLGGAFGNGENMWNAGITFNLDKPNASTSKVAMARAIKTMAADNEALEAKAAEQDEKIALLTAQVEALMAAQKK